MWTFISFHLIEPPFSLSLKTISSIFLAYSLGIIGSPISAIAEKMAINCIRTFGVLLLASGITLTLSQSLVIIIFCLCIACLGFFTTHALTLATVSRTAIHQKGSASSLYLVSYYIGVTCGSTLLSPIWGFYQWQGIVFITIILLFCPLFMYFFYFK